MIIVPFEKGHLLGARAHPKQSSDQDLIDQGKLLEGWTAFENGNPVCFGGLVNTDKIHGGWLLFTDRMEARHFVPIYRFVRKVLRAMKEAELSVFIDVERDYVEGHRLARLLGFEAQSQHDGMVRMIHGG